MFGNWSGRLLAVAPIFLISLHALASDFDDLISGTPDVDTLNEKCDPVDFRKTLAPNRFQGDTSFCYAYSSATLIHQRTGVDVSAIDLATSFYFTHPDQLGAHPHRDVQQFLTENPDWRATITSDRDDADISQTKTSKGEKVQRPYFHALEGGVEDVTALLASTKGLCREKDLPSDYGLTSHLKQINQFVLQAETATDWKTPPEIDGVHQKYRDPVADLFNGSWLRYVEKSCKRVPLKSPLIPVNFDVARSYEDFANKVASGEIDRKKAAHQLFNALNFALDRKRTPAVGYSLFTFSPREANDPDLFADHSSAVIARRKIKNKCQYLIRDASGLTCDDYLPKYRKRCQNADFWVTREELAQSLYSVVYLR